MTIPENVFIKSAKYLGDYTHRAPVHGRAHN